MTSERFIRTCLAILAALIFTAAGCSRETPPATHLDSLSTISIEALRERRYDSTIKLEEKRSDNSFLASYRSDGLRIYTRIDVPETAMPAGGYPVLVFVHGWYGREAAPEYDFFYGPDSLYSRLIGAYTEAGFLVLSPALRGHGSVNGVAAEGLEFLEDWDNGSYISPMFYAIDVLNLLEGVPGLATAGWNQWGVTREVFANPAKINIAGHSQGGDVALAALAVSGEESMLETRLAAGSIWSGCFGTRFSQAEIYGPMASTLQAFMSGDGSWTGSAMGRNGEINHDFIFAFPADWIGTVDPQSQQWTWQADTWSTPTVADAWRRKFGEMYDAINRQVGDIDGASFEVFSPESGRSAVRHDPRVELAMQKIGAFDFAQYLMEPVHFHHSDQDYYSIPEWNADLAERIRLAGGHSADFTYPANNHSLLASEHAWFSHGEVVEGFPYMIERDLALFLGKDPADENPASLKATRLYSSALRNEFTPEFNRANLDGISRQVVSFTSDGLKQFALVLTPPGEAPENGWPVLLMNHGYHPNPPGYGRTAEGDNDRPGDYYRGLPRAYAERGFLVVVPDYRGHNDSEGLEFTTMPAAHRWYTRDVVASFRALGSLPGADTANVFMWGHSMGGSITARALLALGSEVRGASLWSSSEGQGDEAESISLTDIRTPLVIQHSEQDGSTPFSWSQSAFEELSKAGHPVQFYTYPGSHHLFTGEELLRAIARDVRFFKELMQ